MLANSVVVNNECFRIYCRQYSEIGISMYDISYTINSKRNCDFLVLWRRTYG